MGSKMNGKWIFICGPSGVGKDSVIAWAQQTLLTQTEIVFARRIVTRDTQAGSDHDPMTESDFLLLRKNGGLAWHWEAHGFSYGIAQHYAAQVKAGHRVVVNGSRAHVNTLHRSLSLCQQLLEGLEVVEVVEITADPAKLATRLQLRGRDSATAVTERLTRNGRFTPVNADCVIANDGALSVAGQRLADYLTT